MSWHQGDVWRATVEDLEIGIHEYKYVVVDHATGRAVDWQRGNNSVLALSERDLEAPPPSSSSAGGEEGGSSRRNPAIEVSDNWEGSPGASVTGGAGGLASTRELRLSAWAKEISESLALARKDLRTSRLDLAAARSDAQQARVEAASARAALAEAERSREAAVRLVEDLRAANGALRAQLVDNAAAFRAALGQAVELLDGAAASAGGGGGGGGAGSSSSSSSSLSQSAGSPSSSSSPSPAPAHEKTTTKTPAAAAAAPSRGFGGFGFASNKR